MRERIFLQIGNKTDKILVTRPQLRAQKTLQRLGQLGLGALAMPLSDIRPFFSQLPAVENIVTVVVSSAASFFYIDKTYLATIAHLPFYCIGCETAKAAIACGCTNIAAIVSDLDEFILTYTNIQAPLLYLCGRRRRKALEYKWREMALDYRLAETYETVPCNTNINKILTGQICLASVAIVLLTSTYSAKLCSLIVQYLPEQVKYVCFSKRIAQALPKNLAQNIYIAAKPDEASAIELISNLISN